MALRNLILILGDQLDLDSSAFDGFDASRDAVWMAEVAAESTHVWSHKARIVMFLSAMRHFADAIGERSWTCHDTTLDARGNTQSLAGELARAMRDRRSGGLNPRQRTVWRMPSSAGKKTR